MQAQWRVSYTDKFGKTHRCMLEDWGKVGGFYDTLLLHGFLPMIEDVQDGTCVVHHD